MTTTRKFSFLEFVNLAPLWSGNDALADRLGTSAADVVWNPSAKLCKLLENTSVAVHVNDSGVARVYGID